MELTVVDYVGLPEGSILSVRSGPTRRQSPLPCPAPFSLPGGPWPLRIDVLGLLGKTAPSVNLTPVGEDCLVKLPLEGKGGRKMSVTLQVHDTTPGAVRPKTTPDMIRRGQSDADAAGASTSSLKRRGAEADARAYLDKHRLHEFMHGLFELLLRERPEDPYKFMADRFVQASHLELQAVHVPTDALLPKAALQKTTQSCASTAPSSSALSHPSMTASVSRDLSPKLAPSTSSAAFADAPEGAFKVTFYTMRRRTVTRLVVQPGEKVAMIKRRLEQTVGAPASALQLMWWAEMLPNDTTLEDHFIEPGRVTLNIITCQRSPREKYVISGSSEGGMRLWNLADAEKVRDLVLPSASAVLDMKVDWEKKKLVNANFDGQLQLWDLSEGSCLKTIAAHQEEVSCVEVDWIGLQALTGSSDGTAKLWCIKEWKRKHTLQAGSTIHTLSVDWQGNKAFAGLRTGLVRCWDLISGDVVADYLGATQAAKEKNTAVSGVAIDCLGRRAVSGFEDGRLAYWHLDSVEPASSSTACAASGSKDAEKSNAAGASEQTTLPPNAPKVWMAHYSALRTLVAHWKDKGSRVLAGSDDGSLSLWRIDSFECLARFGRHIGFVWSIYADWENERVVSGAFDGCLKLWDLKNGECIRTIQGHSRPIRSIGCG
eukprot:TRINITY_DN103174_c0_g1_i1.p1 TRINITY_DN103174_c0_g1~~TRINITY_DN103174_c0_g1_i1.p1  ORF type:complete len:669 (+),score=104.80 TRINITY_DN103174_c0_g1_i1:40-2007(+)